jgi:flagellar biosynthesis protein FliR
MTANELLARFSEQQVAAFFLVLARVSPLFILAPLFSSKMIPGRVRTVVAVGLAVGLMPVVKHGPIDLDPLAFGGLIVKEVVVGLSFAYALAAMFAGLQVAGSLLDTLIGFSFGSLVDPVTGNQSTVIAQLYSLFGVAILIAIGGDEWMIQGLARSYDVVPLLATPSLEALTSGALDAFVGIFRAALEIAAPVVIALVLTDVAFGMVSRTVPQMNVFAVGFPAKIVVGLMIAGVSLPFVAGWLNDELQASVNSALQSLRLA